MSEWIVLGWVAVALYLFECCAWIEAAAVACFKPALRSFWRCVRGATLPGNERGGVVMLDPTNLGGAVIVCHVWPFSLSPFGLTNLAVDGGTGSPQEPRFIPFEEVETVRAEFGEIYVNGKRLARTSSSVLATQLVDLIECIRRRRPGERASEIKAAIVQTLDDGAATRRWVRFEKATRTLRACCVMLFVFAWVISPLVLLLIGPYPAWMFLLAGVLGLAIATAIAYFRSHATLYPEAAYDRWVHSISMVLLPVSAMRCVDKLSRDALSGYGWAVVSPMVCGVEKALPVLRQRFIDVSTGSDDFGYGTVSTSAVDCAQWFRQLVASETKAALDRLNVPVLHAPVPDDETMVSYCPRCHEQFRCGDAPSCPDCSNVQLISFCPPDSPAARRV
jgi:hypothetical protein